jgi:RNA polymerase sigma factor (sigma-70 family)
MANNTVGQAAELDDELLAWTARIARGFAAKLPASFEADDLIQVARMAALRKLPTYDPEKNDSVQGFLYPWVSNAMRMHVRRRNWVEATAPRLSASMQAKGDTEAAVDSSFQSKLLRWLIRERLTEQQQFCLLQHQAGVTTDVIAKRLRVPRTAVIDSIESAYEQLRVDLREIGV